MRNILLTVAIAAALTTPLGTFAAEQKGGNHAAVRSSGGSAGHITGQGVRSFSRAPSVRTFTHTESVRIPSTRNFVRVAPTEPRARQHIARDVRAQGVRAQSSGHNHYSHRRHHWHGRWWAYSVGSCWTYDPYWDEYYWVCGDDDDDD